MKITPRVLRALHDLANEIFLRLQQEVGDLAVDDPQGSLCGTLLEIERQSGALNSDGTVTASSDGPSTMESALQALTPDQRDALFLHLGKGMTCAEIADQTGIPRESILIDLVRAYAHVRLTLGKDSARNAGQLGRKPPTKRAAKRRRP